MTTRATKADPRRQAATHATNAEPRRRAAAGATSAEPRRRAAAGAGARADDLGPHRRPARGSRCERGADRAALLKAAGLTPAALAEPDGRVPLTAVYALIEAAVEATSDPHFGLDFAGRSRPEHFDALGCLAMTSPTLGEAFRARAQERRAASGE